MSRSENLWGEMHSKRNSCMLRRPLSSNRARCIPAQLNREGRTSLLPHCPARSQSVCMRGACNARVRGREEGGGLARRWWVQAMHLPAQSIFFSRWPAQDVGALVFLEKVLRRAHLLAEVAGEAGLLCRCVDARVCSALCLCHCTNNSPVSPRRHFAQRQNLRPSLRWLRSRRMLDGFSMWVAEEVAMSWSLWGCCFN